MTPKRVQMTRQRPWRAGNPDAVIVARPSKWGNPWRVVPTDHGYGVLNPRGSMTAHYDLPRVEAIRMAVTLFREFKGYALDDLKTLAGRDLACWCPLDQPCHADVLLELANGGAR